MALLRHAVMTDLSPLSGAKRKSHFSPVTSGFDPQRKWRPIDCQAL